MKLPVVVVVIVVVSSSSSSSSSSSLASTSTVARRQNRHADRCAKLPSRLPTSTVVLAQRSRQDLCSPQHAGTWHFNSHFPTFRNSDIPTPTSGGVPRPPHATIRIQVNKGNLDMFSSPLYTTAWPVLFGSQSMSLHYLLT